MTNTKRMSWLDIARGIAMILVLMGHIKETPTIINYTLYSFHMPLFFIISGLVLNAEKYDGFKDFLIVQLKRIVIPYFLLCLIMLFLEAVLFQRYSIDYIVKSLAGIVLANRRHGVYYSMWYLHVLFLSELMLFPLAKEIKNKRVFFPISLFLIVVGFLLGKSFVGFYWSIDLVPMAMGYLSLGYAAKDYILNDSIKPSYMIPSLFALAAITFIFAYLNHPIVDFVGLYYCKYGNFFYFLIPSITGSLFILWFSKLLNKNAVLEFIGKNTLVIYAFNNKITIPISTKLITFLGGYLPFLINQKISWLFIVLVVCILSSPMSIIITKLCPIVVGKWKIH